jgi:hypothetical protein
MGRSRYSSRSPVSGPRNPLDSAMEQARRSGVGIQPGAQKNLPTDQPWGNPVTQIGGAIKWIGKKLNSTGSSKSPSTRSDR